MARDYQALLEDDRQPFFNRSIAGQYPPASTFKLVTATAALEEGVVTSDTIHRRSANHLCRGVEFFKLDAIVGHCTARAA